MDKQHSHDWRGTVNVRIVECECGQTIRIDDLLRNTNTAALERGKYEAFRQALKNHWLTPSARRLLNDFLTDHHLTKEAEKALPIQRSLL